MANEFGVNSYQNDWQEEPTMLVFPDGSFVIMWRSFYFDASTYYIGVQRYNADGTPNGGELIADPLGGVTSFDGDASEVKNITLLADGGFVITFNRSNGGLLEPDEVYATIVNADFTIRKAAFKVDTVNDFQSLSPDAAALSDGGFIVFYSSDGAGPTFDDIYGQRYDALGNAIGGNFLVNTNETESDQQAVEVEQLANGNILVLWHSNATLFVSGTLYSDELRGTIYNSAGVAIRTDFTIADAEGSASTTGINPFAVTPLLNGGFAVARYETENPSGNVFTYDVKLSIYNAQGNVVLLDTTAFSSTNGLIYSVDVVQLTGGQIVVVWETPVSPLSTYGHDIQGRIFASDGTPLTGVFDIAQNRLDDQEDAELAALPNGGFVVTWTSDDIDPQREGISARIFEPGTFPADPNGPRTLNGTSGDDTLTGTAGVDVINGLAGADSLFGLGGADTLNGLTGSDRLDGGAGADVLLGGDGYDYASYVTATAGVRADLTSNFYNAGDAVGDTYVSIEGLLGSNLNDIFLGDGAVNYIFGNNGADTIYGRGGADYIYGGEGYDVIEGGTGADLHDGGNGFDYASYYYSAAGIRADMLSPGTGTGDGAGDTFNSIEGIQGSLFNDIISGDNVQNYLYGYAGTDVFYSRGGNDFMYGGAGDDIYYFGANYGKDTIGDFQAGAASGDRIQIQASGANGVGAAFDTFAELIAASAQVGANTVITFNATTSITLSGVTLGSLNSGDFVSL